MPKYKYKLTTDLLRANGEKDIEGSYPKPEEIEAMEQQRVMIAQQEIARQNEVQELEDIGRDEYNKEKGRREVIDAIPASTLQAGIT
jgi:hypothetical protein